MKAIKVCETLEDCIEEFTKNCNHYKSSVCTSEKVEFNQWSLEYSSSTTEFSQSVLLDKNGFHLGKMEFQKRIEL